MNDEKWVDLIERIENKLDIEERNEEEGPGNARIETVIFSGPMGRMLLERTSRPLVLDRKTHYTKRAGTVAKEEFIYSETEKSHRVTLYRWTGEDWEEIEFRQLAGGL